MFKAAGVTETVATFAAEAEANVIRRREPETWARIRHYLFLSGFLVHRLTGEFRDSVAAQVGYVPFDYKALAWAGARRLEVAGRARASARGCRSWSRRAGGSARSPPAAAGITGIPAGLPLIAAAGDKACEVLGLGRAGAARRRDLAGHDGHVQHDPPPLRGGRAGRAALPRRGPRRVLARGPGLPRLLDDRVVQARVRGGRGGPGARGGRGHRGPVRRPGRRDTPGLHGPRAPAVLVAGRARARDPRRREPSSAGATSTRGPTCTGRSSRDWPTPCARAWSGPRSGRRCR